MAHDLPWSIGAHTNAQWKGYGGWGVQLFFALSGVLICWRMLEEESKAGRLRLSGFYARRLFRIQPAAYTYLAIILLLGLTGCIPFSWTYWASAALSYTNFLVTVATPPGAPAFVGHFWTLAVEEHFYLLISFLFLLTVPTKRVFVLFGLLILLWAAQTYAMNHGAFSPIASPRRTYWIVQLLLVPSLLTFLVRIPRVKAFVLRWGAPGSTACLILIAMLINQKVAHRGIRHLLQYGALDFIVQNGPIVIYGFGFLVIAVMFHPKSLTTRFLEWAPLRSLGRWSYSVYLWHVLFFIPIYLDTQVRSQTLMLLSGRPWKYIATAISALASYYFIEKPLVRFGHRIAPPLTAGHRDLTGGPALEHIAGLSVTDHV